MKAHPFFFHKLFCSPLMLLEPVRIGLEAELLAHMGMAHGGGSAPRTYGDRSGVSPDEESIEYRKQAAATNKAWRIEQIYQTYGDTAVISIAGPIDKHLSSFEQSCYGGCDLGDVDQALAIAASDPKIQRLVLSMDSPGGSVVGVPETAARVAALRESMEVHAYCDSICASAAYYIASQADSFTATPSAVLGSIGVYSALVDQTRAMEMAGYKVELIKAGKFKAMGASFKPLGDEERAMFQAEVDGLYADFKAAVSSGRPQVSDETMQGQCFRGVKAQDSGLCDNIDPATLDEFLSGLL